MASNGQAKLWYSTLRSPRLHPSRKAVREGQRSSDHIRVHLTMCQRRNRIPCVLCLIPTHVMQHGHRQSFIIGRKFSRVLGKRVMKHQPA